MNIDLNESELRKTLNETIELLELTIRSARRCAYDLKHAAQSVNDTNLAEFMQERASFFIKLFQSGSDVKDYRHKLRKKIDNLEICVDTLRAKLKEQNIEDPTFII